MECGALHWLRDAEHGGEMNVQLKSIDQQVLVITGASSGIGLVTAKAAAQQGARVVLSARNEHDLIHAVEQIRSAGGRAAYAVADVTDRDAVDRLAETALREFGRIDTWVNNAAVAMYGRITELSMADMRRQMDVNFWGAVHGSLTALPHLRKQGGALIIVASAVADRAIPLQGVYCAAKHALKAFTETLRMELEEEGAPISVSLVKPGSIDTPFFQKARTYLGVEPQPVPPVYAPEIVADAILECAQKPVRDIIVGGMGKVLSAAGRFAPKLTDRYMEKTTFDSQKTDRPVAADRRDNLYEPVAYDGGERGNYDGHVLKRSMYTQAAMHPGLTALAAAGAGLGIAAAIVARRRDDERSAAENEQQPQPEPDRSSDSARTARRDDLPLEPN